MIVQVASKDQSFRAVPKMRAPSESTATLQTPPGRGGIAVILLRGPSAERILGEVFRPLRSHACGGEGVLQLGHLVADGQVIDEAVVHRHSGLVEINIHGGGAAAKATLDLLAKRGAKVAESAPGRDESFATGHPRWNNPAVGREMLEALSEARSALVVAALTEQWSAGLSRLARNLLDALRDTASRPGGAASRDTADPAAACPELRDAARGRGKMQRVLRPAEVVLVGPPNAGKSTLANALVGRQVSIVHGAAGTTRDWVRELALLEGVPVWVTDTAGIWALPREPAGPDASERARIEAEAIRRARGRAEEADLVLVIGDGRRVETPDWLHARNVLRVSGQCDVGRVWAAADAVVSAVSGQGLDALRAQVLEALDLGDFDPGRAAAFTRRQAGLLDAAAAALEKGKRRDACDALRQLLEGQTGGN